MRRTIVSTLIYHVLILFDQFIFKQNWGQKRPLSPFTYKKYSHPLKVLFCTSISYIWSTDKIPNDRIPKTKSPMTKSPKNGQNPQRQNPLWQNPLTKSPMTKSPMTKSPTTKSPIDRIPKTIVVDLKLQIIFRFRQFKIVNHCSFRYRYINIGRY